MEDAVAIITVLSALLRTGFCDSYRHNRRFQQGGDIKIALFRDRLGGKGAVSGFALLHALPGYRVVIT
jgi:hypothetical protein